MPQPGRRYHTNQTHYLRKTGIAFDTPGLSAGTLSIGVLPENAQVLATSVAIRTAFNAGSTNVLIVGTAADDDALVAAAGVDETAIGLTRVAPATLAGYVATAGDTEIFAKYTQTGTAATAGLANIVVEYAPYLGE